MQLGALWPAQRKHGQKKPHTSEPTQTHGCHLYFPKQCYASDFRWLTEATQQTVEICWSGSYVKLYPCSPRFGCIPSPVSSTELVWDMMSCIPPHVLLSCTSYIVREKERKRHQHLNWINSHSRRSASSSQLPARCRIQTTIQKSSFRIIQAFHTFLNHM